MRCYALGENLAASTGFDRHVRHRGFARPAARLRMLLPDALGVRDRPEPSSATVPADDIVEGLQIVAREPRVLASIADLSPLMRQLEDRRRGPSNGSGSRRPLGAR